MNNIQKMVKKSGTSFFWGMRLLPSAKRNAMYTIYAFFRHIDDIVDGNAPVEEKLDLLAAWRQEIDNIYDKKVPTTDIGRKILVSCRAVPSEVASSSISFGSVQPKILSDKFPGTPATPRQYCSSRCKLGA